MSIEEILAKQAQGEQLSKEEVDYLISGYSKAVAGKVPDKEPLSLEQFTAALNSATDALRNSPEGRAQLKDSIAERRTQRFVKRYTPFFNALLAGADIAQSLSQVRQSNNAISNLKKPSLPAIPGIDPSIDQAIRQAEIGTTDQARVLGPAKQELQDQYSKDIALAKAVGGGQASTFGALGQVASLRRARGAANLLPMADSIRAREQGRLDNLINNRSNLANQNYYNHFRDANIQLGQYNQDLQTAGQLGSVGRLNLRNSAQSLLNAIPGVAARVGQGYNDKYSQYEQSLNNSLTNKGKVPHPFSQITSDDSVDVYGNFLNQY